VRELFAHGAGWIGRGLVGVVGVQVLGMLFGPLAWRLGLFWDIDVLAASRVLL